MTKSALDTLLFELNNLEEVKEYQKLYQLVKNDENLAYILDRLNVVKKQATNAKHLNLTNAYHEYLEEYQKLMVEIENNVILQMYKNSEAEVKDILTLITSLIEQEISARLNE